MKKFNINEFIWFLILMFIFLFLGYLLISDKLFLIINMNMKKYVIIAIGIIFLLILVQSTKIFTIPSREGIKGGNIIFVFMGCCLILLMQIDVIKTSLEFKGVQLYHDSHFNNAHEHQHTICLNNESINLDNNNFHEGLEELINHVDEYIGRNITLKGIVYLDKKYESKYIVTSFNMNCCIVDSSYLGIMCEGNLKDIKNSQEVTVEGEISKIKIKDKYNKDVWIPLVLVRNIVKNS